MTHAAPRHRIAALATSAFATIAAAQTIQPPFTGIYGYTDLGSVPGVPPAYGGVVFKAGDPNRLLIGGDANTPSGAIYEVVVTRDTTGRITGFQGPATLFATAPNIDGGLSYGPGGVLFYTGYNNNVLGQIESGSAAPDRVIQLSPYGIGGSVGALGFVPANFAGAGELKLASYNANTWHGFTLAPDGNGTYDIVVANGPVSITGGPEGILFVPPGSALIPNYQFVLVAEYAAGAVSLYQLDSAGNPVPASRIPFMTGLGGAEGATTDPITGDLVFSTFGGGDRVITVQGFGVCGELATYGQGIPGTNGVPSIGGGGCAGRGQVASVNVASGRPGATGILVAGFQQISVPVLNGTLLVQPAATFFHLLSGTGQYSLVVALPLDPYLSGVQVAFQGFHSDPAAAAGISATGGLRMTIR